MTFFCVTRILRVISRQSIVYILEVYRMWNFQYSRMRILHFNIRGYRMRMRILYILLY